MNAQINQDEVNKAVWAKEEVVHFMVPRSEQLVLQGSSQYFKELGYE